MKHFCVDKDEFLKYDRSVKVPVRRIGYGAIVEWIYLPLKVINISSRGRYFNIAVPEWLVERKLRSGFTIGIGGTI